MQRHAETALSLARFLEGHPGVVKVVYPGLNSHPQHALAARQMRSPGGMISFEVAGGLAGVEAVLARLGLIVCAESLGGVESLIEHPASMTHAALPPELRRSLGIGDGLLRLSVGLEALPDLRRDLERALAR
jgi:cystathionine beta-lyase/cystathionine gamma-synthase